MKREYVEPPPLFGRRPFRCEVRPRYSAGSPATVPDHVALQVARDERHDYEVALTGAYGDVEKRRAEVLGLRGIAYALAESGSGRNFRWLVYDLVTGECFRRHHDSEVERLRYRPFSELPESVQRAVCETGRRTDYERTYWKTDGLNWARYEPELVRE